MAIWQLLDADGVAQPDQFDDGLAFMPGEDGFSTVAVSKAAAKIGGTFSMIGVPGWHARVEADQRAAAEAEEADRLTVEAAAAKARDTAAAKAKIAEILNPGGYAKDHAAEVLNAEYDILAAFATKPEKAKLRALFDERIAAL